MKIGKLPLLCHIEVKGIFGFCRPKVEAGRFKARDIENFRKYYPRPISVHCESPTNVTATEKKQEDRNNESRG